MYTRAKGTLNLGGKHFFFYNFSPWQGRKMVTKDSHYVRRKRQRRLHRSYDASYNIVVGFFIGLVTLYYVVPIVFTFVYRSGLLTYSLKPCFWSVRRVVCVSGRPNIEKKIEFSCKHQYIILSATAVARVWLESSSLGSRTVQCLQL